MPDKTKKSDNKNEIKSIYGARGFGIFMIISICFLPNYVVNGLPSNMIEIDNLAALLATLIDMVLKSLRISLPTVLLALACAVIAYKGRRLDYGEVDIKEFVRNSLTIINCIYLTALILVFHQPIVCSKMLVVAIIVVVLAICLACGFRKTKLGEPKEEETKGQ